MTVPITALPRHPHFTVDTHVDDGLIIVYLRASVKPVSVSHRAFAPLALHAKRQPVRLLIVPLIALFTFVALLIVDNILKHYESGGKKKKSKAQNLHTTVR